MTKAAPPVIRPAGPFFCLKARRVPLKAITRPLQVAGPTLPSSVRRASRWKERTDAVVALPNRPSMVTLGTVPPSADR